MTMYMKMTDIDGDSKDAKHEKWIVITSYSEGLSRDIADKIDPERDSSQVRCDEIMVDKKFDAASCPLRATALTGKKINEVIIEVVNATDNKTYLKITMKDVLVSSINYTQVSMDGHDECPENLRLNYNTIEWEHTLGGGTHPASWNRSTKAIVS